MSKESRKWYKTKFGEYPPFIKNKVVSKAKDFSEIKRRERLEAGKFD